MNDERWEELETCLRHWWPGEFSAEAAAVYRLALDRCEPGDVARVLGVLLERGLRFRPSAAELMAAIRGAGSPVHPDAEAAWALIEQAVRMVGRSVYATDFAERHQAAVDWLAEQDSAVAWWAARRGLCGAGSLGAEPVGDAEHGGAVRYRLAGEYREVRARVEEREALGGGVSRGDLLVRSTARTGGGMADVVAGLAPAAELPPGDGVPSAP